MHQYQKAVCILPPPTLLLKMQYTLNSAEEIRGVHDRIDIQLAQMR